MKSLMIETSTERGMVCFLDERKVLYHKEFPFGINNSKTLIPAIHEGLHALQLQVSNLDFIGVGTGPGSYTGMRVGAMTAKSISYAVKVPLVGISTLQCFIPQQNGSFAVLIDAKIGGAYVIIGRKKGKEVTYDSEPQVREIPFLGDFLRSVERIVTPDAKKLRHTLEKFYPNAKWEWEEIPPNPVHMGELAKEKFKKNQFSTDGHLELHYLRKTQAEIEKENKIS